MTCIVGYAEDGICYMGGDSAGVSGWDLLLVRDPKVFRKKDMVFGWTGSFRMGQLLEYRLEIPQHHPDVDDATYMRTDFVDAVRACLKEYGFARVEDNVDQGGHFLVGYRGTIYRVESDFQVFVHAKPYDAVGCGSSFALGALHAMRGDDVDPTTRVILALTTAADLSAGVREPFTVVDTKDP